MKKLHSSFAIIILVSFLSAGYLYATPAGKKAAKNDGVLVQDSTIVAGTLENGFSYRILRNAKPENRILFRLVVKAGSILEDDDQRGIAHLVEHMAFNGSEHFAENELVSYFESIGMGFGPDINAYTSFDETVYMLEIPADDAVALEKALTVIRDWACGITFDSVELEKERDVVIEEWRLGRGVSGRIQDKIIPFLLAGSRYAQRMTIGDPDIIRTVSRERVVDFYKKWYRPELMTLVVVGDADEKLIESAIQAQLAAFSDTQSAKKKKAPRRPEYPVKIASADTAPRSLIITDPELSDTVIQMVHLYPATPTRTESDFREQLVRQIAAAILSSRLSEKAEQNAPFLEATAWESRVIRPLFAIACVLVPNPGQFTEAFTSVIDEIDRFCLGITERELERQKSDLQSTALLIWQNRYKTPSGTIADRLINGVLQDVPVLSPDDRYALTTRILESITVAEVNNSIARYGYAGHGNLLIVTAPEAALDTPLQAEVDDIWQNYHISVEDFVGYEDSDDERPLFPPLSQTESDSVADSAPKPTSSESKIVERQLLPQSKTAPKITELTLANGARVILCQTDFTADKFLFTAVSRGGMSLLPDEEVPFAQVASDYLELSGINGFSATEVSKKLAGKDISIRPEIAETYASLIGQASQKDAETFFQLINLYFTAPHFTRNAWNRLETNIALELESRKNNPVSVFINEALNTLYKNSIRFTNMSESTASSLTPSHAESLYRDFFRAGGNFTFIFTGDISLDEVKRLSEIYLATLPSSNSAMPTEAKNNAIPFPHGTPRVTVKKGIEAQSRVLILFGGENPEPEGNVYVEQELASAAASLVEIRLRESLREKTGGTYGVGVFCSISNYPARRFLTQISFGCDPSRAEELAALALEEIRTLQNTLASDADMTKLTESFSRRRETEVKTNGFWHKQLVWNTKRGDTSATVADASGVLSALTPETMQRFIRRCFPLDNYIDAFLLPED